MKRYFCLLAALTATLMLTVACSDDDDDEGGSSVITNPSLTLGTDTFSAGYEAGSYSIAYTLINSVDGGEMYAYSSETWIENISCSGGNVSFSLAENTTGALRTSAIVVCYEYSNKTIIRTAQVTQGGLYSVTISSAYGYYYDLRYSPSTTTVDYYIYLLSSSGAVYNMDFWSSTQPSDKKDITIPEGTYSVGTEGDDNTLGNVSSTFGIANSTGDDYEYEYAFESGSVTVSYSGTTITITGTVTDVASNVHNISYTGTFESFEDSSYFNDSVEDGDHEVDLTNAIGYAYCYDDYYTDGEALWQFYVYNTPGAGFQIYYIGDNYSTEIGELNVSAGTYTGGFTTEKGTYITGYSQLKGEDESEGYTLEGSWYFTYNSSGQGEAPMATLEEGGTVVITNDSEDVVSVTFDVPFGGDGYKLTGSWTGTLGGLMYSVSSSAVPYGLKTTLPETPKAFTSSKSAFALRTLLQQDR